MRTSNNKKFIKYNRFYNEKAIILLSLMFIELDSVKYFKLYRTACRLEHRYREYYNNNLKSKDYKNLEELLLTFYNYANINNPNNVYIERMLNY